MSSGDARDEGVPAEPIRVLHVDDDAAFAELVATHLDRELPAVEVLGERCADDGLARLRDEDVDCVVSDYDMPGADGIEFLAAVREEYPDLPFVLFTGQGSESVASEAISAGVMDYLEKGTGSDQYAVLANRVRNAVEHYRSERALERSRRRLSLFIEQSPLGVIEWNGDYEVVRANDTAQGILGYDDDGLAGRPVEAIVPEHEREEIRAVLDRLHEGRTDYRNVNENVTKDGELIICEWHNRVVTDDAGEVVTMFSQFQEVTERERHKRQLETLIKNLPGMVYRARNEAGWPMEFVSGECEDLTGYPAADLESGEVAYGDVVHPDDRERVWDTVQEAVASDEPFELTYRIRTRGGRRKWVWERGRAVRSRGGEVLAVEGFISDVTAQQERRRTVEALHEATRRSIAADSREAVADIMTDAAVDLLDCPHTGVHLYDEDRDELVPAAWTVVVDETVGDPPALGPGSLAWEAFEAGETRQYNDLRAVDGVANRDTNLRSELIVPLGSQGVMLVSSTDREAFDRDDRKLIELLAANTTAALEKASRERMLRRRERALKRENERLDRFTGVVSHDLRNPLNVAKGRLDDVRAERSIDGLDEVAAALSRMEDLIEDMLTLAREGRTVSDVEHVALGEVAEAAWRNVATDAAALAVETDRTVPADRSRLTQLFENLFRNAVEHSSTDADDEAADGREGAADGGSDVEITVGDLPGGFYVEDDGPGIHESERADVFDAGYSTSGDATGFGLSIVRDIAAAHGWDVAVTEGTAGGARFEFTDTEEGE
ncbi:hybrid sensor histidine kinase/response regulator [Halostella litorea]|uniref:hybrid sensor histidine kinase/response regulator n=1 Tax=Halostella litorea TaxID=2528831 RepID=UPI001091A6D6|nr:PAS domain-containing protein [Halostella litorea]